MAHHRELIDMGINLNPVFPEPGPERSTPSNARVPTIAARFERLPFTRYQRNLWLITATGVFFMAMDLRMLTYMLPSITSDLSLTASQVGWVVSLSTAGMAVGAASAGMLADRFGRRTIFAYSIVTWGVASLLTAFTTSAEILMGLRLMTGIGIGAEIPVAMTMLAEFLPRGKRGRYVSWQQIGMTVAAFLTGATAYVLIPTLGWRSGFLLLFLLSLWGLYVRRQMPESPRWYESQEKHEQADASMTAFEAAVEKASGAPLPAPDHRIAPPQPQKTGILRELFSAAYRRRTLTIWTSWIFFLLANYGVAGYLTKILTDHGMALSTAIMVSTVIQIAGIPACLACSVLLDRAGRKPIIGAAFVCAAVGMFAYSWAPNIFWALTAGAVMELGLIGAASCMHTYSPEVFPTRARATGFGWAETLGTAAGAGGGLLVAFLVPLGGYMLPVGILASCLLIPPLLIALFGPETRGRALEEIENA